MFYIIRVILTSVLYYSNNIERCAMDGTNHQIVVAMMHPYAIAVFEQFIYWTDWIIPESTFTHRGILHKGLGCMC